MVSIFTANNRNKQGTKSEKLNFYFSNILNSLLVPVLNPKSITFSHLVPVQRPRKIEEKNSKKVFFGYLYRSKYLIFRPKKFFKNFGAAFGTWYYLQKNDGSTRYQIRGLPVYYGIFRYFRFRHQRSSDRWSVIVKKIFIFFCYFIRVANLWLSKSACPNILRF